MAAVSRSELRQNALVAWASCFLASALQRKLNSIEVRGSCVQGIPRIDRVN